MTTDIDALLAAHASEVIANSRLHRHAGTLACGGDGCLPDDGPCTVCGAPPVVFATAARDTLRAAYADRLEKLESARATAERHIQETHTLREKLKTVSVVDVSAVINGLARQLKGASYAVTDKEIGEALEAAGHTTTGWNRDRA